ncbi:nuclease-related domain-containing protein [Aeromicrobium ponti]|uniref:Nuclease-like protein n=1 Tax=Cytobacillus oceanisediminis TaxID=665099 RepID=A0A562K755_9BACI|nr:nuclease-related domain-containing protein [Cytobacillus oceanisediminis]TWH91240.1 nuclease-like protein [Cytobacillus oceanisediminis]
MILKERKIPLLIRKLEALLRRLPPLHPKIPLINEDLNKRIAGYKGEASIDFHLDFLDSKGFFIFHDIRLPDGPRFFQIDTLVLTKKFALVLEVKNITGILQFDTVYNQLIRTKNGEEQVFPCPILQVNRQASQLGNWFSANAINGSIPIYSIVVISNQHTRIKVIPPHINLSQKVIHRDTLPTKIQQIEKSIKNEISDKLFKKIIRLLKKQNTEGETSILSRFQIKESEVLTGVFCPACNHLPLVRVNRTWHCTGCKSTHKDAHIKALNDYNFLIGTTITNKESRDFLHLDSSYTATRLLKSLNLPHTGANKNRTYTLFFPNENTSQQGRRND